VSTHDDDIDFDFFEEPATQEAPGRERTVRRPSGRGPRRPLRPPTGFTPLLRLVALVLFAIVIVVLVVFWAQGCQDSKKHDEYSSYMDNVRSIAVDSEKVGRQLSDVLTTPGLKQADIDTRLAGLAQQAEQDVSRAQELDPPGPLVPENDHMIDSLQLRVSGIRGLGLVFDQTKSSKDANAAGRLLANQADRLVASDVVWNDFFRLPSQRVLKEEGVTGVVVPASNFVQTTDLASSRSMTPIWQRIHGASTGGTPTGSHGTGLESVTVKPSGQVLSTSTETTIKASTDLAFDVAVKDTGEGQEVKINVTLTIPNPNGNSIVKTQTIDIIDPGEVKTVTFTDFPQVPFGEKINLRVDVKKVPGETNLTNNSAEYPVFFSI